MKLYIFDTRQRSTYGNNLIASPKPCSNGSVDDLDMTTLSARPDRQRTELAVVRSLFAKVSMLLKQERPYAFKNKLTGLLVWLFEITRR